MADTVSILDVAAQLDAISANRAATATPVQTIDKLAKQLRAALDVAAPKAPPYRPGEVDDAVEAFDCLVGGDKLCILEAVKNGYAVHPLRVQTDLASAWFHKRWPKLSRVEKANTLLRVADYASDVVRQKARRMLKKAREAGEL
jgi:hypothetical protein